MNTPRAWAIFIGSVLIYLIAVTQRSTFGIAGVQATERFEVTAAALSTVAVVQVATYALLQIPVGILADRFGPRFMLIAGASVMTCGQLLLATAEEFWLGLVARILVGAGDAFVFVSILRLLPNWFRGRILSQLTQWLGMLGQFGQLLSAFPFVFILHSFGWEPAFLSAAGLAMVAIAIGILVVRNGRSHDDGEAPPEGSILRRLRLAVARPGTQLGFWSHMLGGTAPGLMGMMWGYPFLTAALGYDIGTASTLLSMIVVGGVLPAPVIGWAIARYPFRRGDMVLGMASLIYGVWLLVLLWPGEPPVWLVATLFFVIGAGGPSSLIGMDFARSFNPAHTMGAVSGFVNVGGFLGAFTSMFLVGVVLDLVDAARVAGGGVSELYALESFRIAFLVYFAVPLTAAVCVILTRRWLRRVRARDEGIEAVPIWVALFRSFRRPGSDEQE